MENEDVVGAAPIGDAPTTSEWSTILLPTIVHLILETWRYVVSFVSILKKKKKWLNRFDCNLSKTQGLHSVSAKTSYHQISWSLEMGCYSVVYLITLKFDRSISITTAEMAVQFWSNRIIPSPHLMALRSCESWGRISKMLMSSKFSPVYKINIFQCTDKTFCVKCQPFEIPHKISYPYIERCNFNTILKF